MDCLNDKVGDKYCEICGSNIRNRTKHIESKKHIKNMRDMKEVLNDAALLDDLFTDFDMNNKKQVDNMIDELTKIIKSHP
jgi:hypothetical protein